MKVLQVLIHVHFFHFHSNELPEQACSRPLQCQHELLQAELQALQRPPGRLLPLACTSCMRVCNTTVLVLPESVKAAALKAKLNDIRKIFERRFCFSFAVCLCFRIHISYMRAFISEVHLTFLCNLDSVGSKLILKRCGFRLLNELIALNGYRNGDNFVGIVFGPVAVLMQPVVSYEIRHVRTGNE